MLLVTTVCYLTNYFEKAIWKEGQTKGISKIYHNL